MYGVDSFITVFSNKVIGLELDNIENHMKKASTVVIPSHEFHHNTEGLHTVIGLALVLGFIFMLLIDQIGSSRARGTF